MGPFQQCLLEINKITSSLCPSIQCDIVSLFQPTQTFLVSFLDTTSVTAAAIPMFLKYLSCCGQLSISVNHQMHGQGFWVWDCQFSPHHTWTSALRCRCGLHTWMGGGPGALPAAGMSSIGSPADCELQPDFSEHARRHHQCRSVGVKWLLTSFHLLSSNEMVFS